VVIDVRVFKSVGTVILNHEIMSAIFALALFVSNKSMSSKQGRILSAIRAAKYMCVKRRN